MKVRDFKSDSRNANRGTGRGSTATTASLKKYGAGRSILVDRDGRIIAGNHVAAYAPEAGIKDAIVVESDGSKLVVVKRTDLSLDDDKARELAIADNRTAELGLQWDPEVLAELSADLDLKPFFNSVELSEIIYPEDHRANDVSEEYVGMPEYSSEDKMGERSLIVHFPTLKDADDFAKAIGQSFSEKAKFIWYPKEPAADLASFKFIDEHDTAEISDIHSNAE